jgi:hypothetical protein
MHYEYFQNVKESGWFSVFFNHNPNTEPPRGNEKKKKKEFWEILCLTQKF